MRSGAVQRCAKFILDEYENATTLWDPMLTPYCPDPGWTEFCRGDHFPLRRELPTAQLVGWMSHVIGMPLPGVLQSVSAAEYCDWSEAPRDSFQVLLHAHAVTLPACAHCNAPSAFLRQCAACREVRYCNSTW